MVDDGSTDETASRLHRYRDQITLIRHTANRGVSAARNSGIRAASGEWIAPLDSDDYWHPDKLEQQIGYLKAHPQVKICQSGDIWIRNGTRINPKTIHQKKSGWIYRDCLPRCIVSSSDVMIHRSVFDTVGLFDESLPACEDYDLYLRIAHRFQIGLVNAIGTTKRGGHSDQLSQRYWGMDRFRIVALQKMLASELSADDRHETHQILIEKLNLLINGSAKHGRSALAQEWRSLLATLVPTQGEDPQCPEQPPQF